MSLKSLVKMTKILGPLLAMTTAASAHAAEIRVDGTSLKDEFGRTLLLRGVNLGADSKLPANLTDDPRAVTFVGRPFPLDQADEHFRRLQSWGLTFERLVVPWEAVEHAGPGEYDRAYLDYLHELVRRAGAYGIRVFIDVHQDGFSRALGGDGAPYWAVRAVGLVPDKTKEAGAPGSRPASYWPPSSSVHAISTMETLFWAGDEFAPSLKVDGVPVQQYLQDHYIQAVRQVALRLRDLDNVVGFDTYNEPRPGYIGVKDLRAPEPLTGMLATMVAPGAAAPTNWDFIQAASGYTPAEGSVVAPNPLWAPGAQDLWRRYGVWDVVDGRPVLLKPDYFATVAGQAPDVRRYIKRFETRYLEGVREAAPQALIFQEIGMPGVIQPDRAMRLDAAGVVYAPHWYEAVSLVTKRYTPGLVIDVATGRPIKGDEAVGAYFTAQYAAQKAEGDAMGVPTVIGETGLPFDMNGKAAYRSGDFSAQEHLAGLLFDALDRALVSYTLWNYSATNTNALGDGWNSEDLSIFSLSQQTDRADINSGGRALHQIVRPYPLATAGRPVSMKFDVRSRTFTYRYVADPKVKADTEIFVPKLQYPHGFQVAVQGGVPKPEPALSRLRVRAKTGEVEVVVTPR